MALAALRSEGLIERRSGQGTYVANITNKPRAMSHDTAVRRVGMAYLDYLTQPHPNDPDASHPPVYMAWMQGIHDYYGVGNVHVDAFNYSKRHMLDAGGRIRSVIEDHQIDGLLVTGWVGREDADYFAQQKIPVVVLEQRLAGYAVPSVVIDRVTQIRLLAGHLADLGHDRVVIVHYLADPSIRSEDDLHACVRIAQAAGLRHFTRDHILQVDNDSTQPPRDMIVAQVENALQMGSTAIIAGDEIIANVVIGQCMKHGLRVPGDVSVTSVYDMTPQVHPVPLTAAGGMSLIREASRVACEMLDQLIDGVHIWNETARIVPGLTVRESTGPVRAC